MRLKRWFLVTLMGALIAALGIPPDAWTALAQQEGPQSPVPGQQEPVKPPITQQQQPPKKSEESLPQVAISVQSTLVNVDAVVTDQDGNIVTGLKRENFRISDNGQRQQITNFAPTEAPITIVMLMEFSARFGGYFGYKAKNWSAAFLGQLKPQDWVALKIFDLKTTVLNDFTQNKGEVEQNIASLFFPTFSEANLFDSMFETLNELRDVKGKKSILLLATGFDTLSRHTLGDMLTRLKETDVTIFCVGMGEDLDLGGGAGIDYQQAKNQLTAFARMTGGYAWFPRFQGEESEIFSSVAGFLRNQYTLIFAPTTPQDGKYHKLLVETVDDQGNPLELVNKKGKMKKTIVIAREGYTALNTPTVN